MLRRRLVIGAIGLILTFGSYAAEAQEKSIVVSSTTSTPGFRAVCIDIADLQGDERHRRGSLRPCPSASCDRVTTRVLFCYPWPIGCHYVSCEMGFPVSFLLTGQ